VDTCTCLQGLAGAFHEMGHTEDEALAELRKRGVRGLPPRNEKDKAECVWYKIYKELGTRVYLRQWGLGA